MSLTNKLLTYYQTPQSAGDSEVAPSFRMAGNIDTGPLATAAIRAHQNALLGFPENAPPLDHFLSYIMRNQPDAMGIGIVPGRQNGTGHGIVYPDSMPRPNYRKDESGKMIDDLGRPAVSRPPVNGPPMPPMYKSDKPGRDGKIPLNPEWLEWNKKYGRNF